MTYEYSITPEVGMISRQFSSILMRGNGARAADAKRNSMNDGWLRSVSGLMAIAAAAIASTASAQTFRVVTYNIQADFSGTTTPQPGLYEVLEGIGQQKIQGNVQPADIVALQETASNTTTVDPIVTNLNSYYTSSYTGPAIYKPVYARSTVQGGQSGSNLSGNGPNALVYNTTTLQLVASVGVGTPQGSGNGEYRQVMRYEFKPAGTIAASNFYVYVTHMKSSATGVLFTNETYRNQEAAIIRNDAATLVTASNPNPRILYVGDFNLDGSAAITSGGQSVSAYQTMTAAGTVQAIDPLNTNPQNNNITWAKNANYESIMTQSSTFVQYRDDYQFMTASVYNESQPVGLKYIPGSLHAFGNNGSSGYQQSVNKTTNTALDNLQPINTNAPLSKSSLLSYLTTASDHLPVVADYVSLVRGDFNLDGQLTTDDLQSMLNTMADLNSYKSSYNLSTSDLLAIGDIDRDGLVKNSDIQPLLSLIASGNPLAGVPEPASLMLMTVGFLVVFGRFRHCGRCDRPPR